MGRKPNGGANTATATKGPGPGWIAYFRHPARKGPDGKTGMRVRRGLGTTDATEAAHLTRQIDELLADAAWWPNQRRDDALRRFDSRVVNAFYDGIDADVGNDLVGRASRQATAVMSLYENGARPTHADVMQAITRTR